MCCIAEYSELLPERIVWGSIPIWNGKSILCKKVISTRWKFVGKRIKDFIFKVLDLCNRSKIFNSLKDLNGPFLVGTRHFLFCQRSQRPVSFVPCRKISSAFQIKTFLLNFGAYREILWGVTGFRQKYKNLPTNFLLCSWCSSIWTFDKFTQLLKCTINNSQEAILTNKSTPSYPHSDFLI